MTVKEIMLHAITEHRFQLTEIESKDVIKDAGIPVVESRLARTTKEAFDFSIAMGFPVVLKIISPDITHKSDIGGVRLGLKNGTQVREAFRDMIGSIKKNCPNARIHGVSVQKMARPGIEIIIGMTKDPQFGPVIMFGIGGIFVEVLKDVSFRIVPLTKNDATEMIKEIKGYTLFEGYRGQESVDTTSLADLILKVSNFIKDNPEIKELDLNPIFAYKDGALVVDARIILETSVIC